jgi:DNA invertase Pin-like site-specific DNA recombinase
LSRDAHFLLGLQKADVSFVAADNLTIEIMALVAQQEREAISRRTGEALAAAKARGQKLGGSGGLPRPRRMAPTGARPEEPRPAPAQQTWGRS